MNNQEQLARITRMVEIYDKSVIAVEELLQAAENYKALQSELKELETYYQSPQWLADFDDDRAGKIPRTMKRGILTEDAIYDLLTDKCRLIKSLKTMIETN